MGKSNDLTVALYNKHIQIYKQKEQAFLSQLSKKAKNSVEELINMTDPSKQDKEIDEAIAKIESLISFEKVKESSDSAERIQQKVAQMILDLDRELQVFGSKESISGLKALADGNYGKAITSAKDATNLVSNAELNGWIAKIMVRINQIKESGQQKQFTGYLSNLKGAYLEAAVMAALKDIVPEDVEATGTIIVNTGNMGSGSRRQIAEDIMIVYSSGAKQSLQSLLEGQNTKKRINIPVYTYENILQPGSAGISVKAGAAPIKFYEGNLNKFFLVDGDDVDVSKYHQNVLNRSFTKQTDNEEGRSVNRYLVAYHLQDALGHNNIFLATRSRLLTTMSQKLTELRDNAQLYMTSYKISKNNISGRIYEPKY